MPIVRITMAKGKSAAYLAAVSDSIYEAMVEKFDLPAGDKFHIFEQLDFGSFVYDRDYASPDQRTDDFMVISVISDARRAAEKTATFEAICRKLGLSPGVKPQDVMVHFITVSTREDFSLGYGISAATTADGTESC